MNPTVEASWESGPSDRAARLMLVAAAATVGVLAAILFVGWPSIDLAVARIFYVEPRHFALNDWMLANALRGAFKLVTWAVGITTVAGLALALFKGRRLLDLGLAQWMFMALVLIIGPGLIANTLLKDHWGRPRPLQVSEFGGPDRFTPVLERTGTCARNCSFISGESSSIFAIGFAAAMLARRKRGRAMALAVAAGAVAGLIRIGEGGHFLSDTVFAGVLMALTVALVHFLVFSVLGPRLPEEGWWHQRSLRHASDLGPRLGESKAKLGSAWSALRKPNA